MAFNRAPIARKLIGKCEIARVHLKVVEACVSLVSPSNFSSEFRSLKSSAIQSQQFQHETQQNGQDASRKRKTQLAVLFKLARLWKAKEPSISLQGVVRANKAIAREGQEQADALGAYWGKIFSHSKLEKGTLGDIWVFCKKHLTKWDFSSLPPPSPKDFLCFLERAVDSSPGPDGIPYSAWLDADGIGAETLFFVGLHFARGCAPPLWFNESVAVFLAKGSLADDGVEVIREV